jgi:hypothetical protein
MMRDAPTFSDRQPKTCFLPNPLAKLAITDEVIDPDAGV